MPVNGLVAVVVPLLEEAMHCGVSLSHWPAHQSLTGQLDSVSAIASSLLAGSLLVPCVITYSQLRVPFLFPAQLHSNRNTTAEHAATACPVQSCNEVCRGILRHCLWSEQH